MLCTAYIQYSQGSNVSKSRLVSLCPSDKITRLYTKNQLWPLCCGIWLEDTCSVKTTHCCLDIREYNTERRSRTNYSIKLKFDSSWLSYNYNLTYTHVGHFKQDIAHNCQTILNRILGAISLLLQRTLFPPPSPSPSTHSWRWYWAYIGNILIILECDNKLIWIWTCALYVTVCTCPDIHIFNKNF